MLWAMPDARVSAALSHWAPRFIANGVDYNDFARVTGGIDSWDSWCEHWSRAASVHENLGHAAMDDGRVISAGSHLAQAAVYYHFAKFLFTDDIEQMRRAHQRAVRCLTQALPYLDPPGERIEIGFEGSVIAGVLRRPPGPGPHPLVVLIPGLDSAKEEFRPTEDLFLRRGLATISVDGPGQGEAEYDLPIRGDWEVPGDAILTAVSALPGIDPERIGIWGVSLGGYYAPRIAASGDPRVKATIALCGPYRFGDCWDQLPDLTRAAFQVRSRSASAAEARERAGELSLAGLAGKIRAPLLIVAGRKDRLIPPADAERLAAEAGDVAELLMLEEGNHGCANLPYLHRQYSADWMARQLGPARPGTRV